MKRAIKLVLLAATLLYLVIFISLNGGSWTFYLWKEKGYTQPVVFWIFIAFFLGGAAVFLYYLFQDMRGWRRKRSHIKEVRKKEADRQAAEKAAYAAQAGNPAKARKMLEKRSQSREAGGDTWLKMAELAIDEGRLEKAEEALETARTREIPTLPIRVRLAEAWLERGEAIKAQLNVDRAGQEEKDHPLIQRTEILIAQRNGEWERASNLQEARLRRLGKEASEREKARWNAFRLRWAERLIEEGSWIPAEALLSELSRNDDSGVGVLLKSRLLERQGKTAKAISLLEKSYRPGVSRAILDQLMKLSASEKGERRSEWFRKASESHPQDEVLAIARLEYLLSQSKGDEALEQWTRVVQLRPDAPQWMLGEAQRFRGRLSEAVEAFHKDRESRPNGEAVYACRSCDASSAEWKAVCDRCGESGGMIHWSQRSGDRSRSTALVVRG